MQDMKAHLKCALIRDLATDPVKRELFARLAEHLGTLAGQVVAAIAARLGGAENAAGWFSSSARG